MAIWSKQKTPPANLNGGNQYAAGDQPNEAAFNAANNNAFYAVDIVESMGVGGAYSSAVTYKFPNIVLYNGNGYMAIYKNNGEYVSFSNKVPTDTSYWKMVAQKGNTGAAGNDGTNGLSIFIRYATSSAGANMSTTPSAATKYVGFYQGATASTNAANYTWSQYVAKEITSVTLVGKTFTIAYDDNTTSTVEINTSQCLATSRWGAIVMAIDGQAGFVKSLMQPNISYIEYAGTSATTNTLHFAQTPWSDYTVTINWGDGSQAQTVTIPQGTNNTYVAKPTNYNVDGHYLISVSGDFFGFKVYGAAQVDLDKYIKVYFGTNLKNFIDIHPPEDCYIADRAFTSCSNLIEVHSVFPIKKFGEYAFSGCSKIKSIVPNPSSKLGVEFGNGAFENCYNLFRYEELKVEQSQKYGINSFKNCGLKIVNVTHLPTTEFSSLTFSGCKITDIIADGAQSLADAAATALSSAGAILMTNYRKLYY